MNIVGIVSEYNPFHNGHAYQLEKSKKDLAAEGVIAIMSGNFIQRGQPALMDKWRRTRAALLGGVDVVLELPVTFAIQSAETFARGAVDSLSACGIVSHLSFGSECGDLSALTEITHLLSHENPSFEQALKIYLNEGLSFPQAREKAVCEFTAHGALLSQPNNILGVEYLKALQCTNIKPYTVTREGTGYHDLHGKGQFASATAIRSKLLNQEDISAFVSPSTYSVVREALAVGAVVFSLEKFAHPLLTLLRRATLHELRGLPDVSEGLEHRMKEMALKSTTITEWCDRVKTKRYTHTRLTRALLHLLLGITEKPTTPHYLRVLGMTEKGKELLHLMRKKASLPLITKAAHITKLSPEGQAMLQKDFLASDLYTLALDKTEMRQGNADLLTSPIRC